MYIARCDKRYLNNLNQVFKQLNLMTVKNNIKILLVIFIAKLINYALVY
jgi:hypothetical protein